MRKGNECRDRAGDELARKDRRRGRQEELDCCAIVSGDYEPKQIIFRRDFMSCWKRNRPLPHAGNISQVVLKFLKRPTSAHGPLFRRRLAALIFEYINGFHDAANAIATVVSTKVLTRAGDRDGRIFNLTGA